MNCHNINIYLYSNVITKYWTVNAMIVGLNVSRRIFIFKILPVQALFLFKIMNIILTDITCCIKKINLKQIILEASSYI